jgi:hypothetical protein
VLRRARRAAPAEALQLRRRGAAPVRLARWGHHTCDAPICAEHAFQVDQDKHLCPAHVEAYRLWLRDVVGVAY